MQRRQSGQDGDLDRMCTSNVCTPGAQQCWREKKGICRFSMAARTWNRAALSQFWEKNGKDQKWSKDTPNLLINTASGCPWRTWFFITQSGNIWVPPNSLLSLWCRTSRDMGVWLGETKQGRSFIEESELISHTMCSCTLMQCDT